MKRKLTTTLSLVAGAAIACSFVACGGGHHGSGDTLYYPYETVYGDICSSYEPTPGCTFDRATGQRITVSHDPDYDRYGGGSDDMWFVTFDGGGRAKVYDANGVFQYYEDVANFAGYVGGYSIGVGSSGLYWEDIRNG